MEPGKKINKLHSYFILDEAWSPVARFRLLSKGINENTRLLESERVIGDAACLACGNCIDQCPVVRNHVGRVFTQNQRTSMQLETIVQEECRRCYRCVNACPQVSKQLKEYTLAHRWVERNVHLIAALVIVSLAATGVTYSHYGELLGGFESGLLKYGHRIIGIFSPIVPYLYYRFDVCHFRRTLKRVFGWGKQDLIWLRHTLSHVFHSQLPEKISRQEFNPGQKIWYLFIMLVFPVLYLSGWISIIIGMSESEVAFLHAKIVHGVFALSFDLMLFIHIYIKFIREWAKNGYQFYRNYQKTRSFEFTQGLESDQPIK